MKGNEILNVQGRQTHTTSTPKDSKTTLDSECTPENPLQHPGVPPPNPTSFGGRSGYTNTPSNTINDGIY